MTREAKARYNIINSIEDEGLKTKKIILPETEMIMSDE